MKIKPCLHSWTAKLEISLLFRVLPLPVVCSLGLSVSLSKGEAEQWLQVNSFVSTSPHLQLYKPHQATCNILRGIWEGERERERRQMEMDAKIESEKVIETGNFLEDRTNIDVRR